MTKNAVLTMKPIPKETEMMEIKTFWLKFGEVAYVTFESGDEKVRMKACSKYHSTSHTLLFGTTFILNYFFLLSTLQHILEYLSQ